MRPMPEFVPSDNPWIRRTIDRKTTGSVRLYMGLYRTGEEQERWRESMLQAPLGGEYSHGGWE